MSSYKKPSNYTSIPVTCSTSREPLKTSKIDRIQQSPWRPATLYVNYRLLINDLTYNRGSLLCLTNSSVTGQCNKQRLKQSKN